MPRAGEEAMDVNGQAAIITGGGSGLGEATAHALAAKGAKVALFDVVEDAAQRVAGEIGGVACVCDVTGSESTEAAIAKARAANGPARIVIQCAGIAPPAKIVGRYLTPFLATQLGLAPSLSETRRAAAVEVEVEVDPRDSASWSAV